MCFIQHDAKEFELLQRVEFRILSASRHIAGDGTVSGDDNVVCRELERVKASLRPVIDVRGQRLRANMLEYLILPILDCAEW